MMLQILHVPDCPGAEALDNLLGPLIAVRPDIQVTRQVVTTEDEAALVAMTGSPSPWKRGWLAISAMTSSAEGSFATTAGLLVHSSITSSRRFRWIPVC